LDFALIAFDGAARLVVRDSARQTLDFRGLDSASMSRKVWRRRVPAVGSIGVRVEALERAAMRGARVVGALDVPADRGFGMSDVLVAERLAPREGRAPRRWSDMFIAPSVGQLRRGQQFSMMWETYELAATPEGTNRYRVDIGLRQLDRSRLSRIVTRVLGGTVGSREARAGRAGQQVAMSFTREVPAGPMSLDYLALSLGETGRGRFRLTITITDLVSGRSVTRERDLTVTDR
jgi:hypothetical protein